jgi:hypothetical protein
MRGLHLVGVFCVFSVALVAADNAFLGTWKLNVAKSKGTPGTMSKDETVVFASDGHGVKRTVTGIDADGQKINMSATIPWDGNAHKVDGPTGPIMVAVKSVDERTLSVTVKSNDKVVSSGRVVLSRDGKTMTASFKGEDPKGRKIDNVEVYDKQ